MLRDQVTALGSSMFNEWSETLLEGLRRGDGELGLQSSGNLMDFDVEHAGILKVHFSERLVVLVREVRQLNEIGYAVDPAIQTAVATAEKYFRYALQLQQVASFYNTMSEQILPSQALLVIQHAEYFERVIHEHKKVVWDDPKSVDTYMKKLLKVAEKLTSRNSFLRAAHSNLATEIASLMSIDLLRQRAIWDQKLEILRGVFREEENKNAGKTAQWRDHWDQQLYKVFEVQYRDALFQLGEQKTEISVDLIYTSEDGIGFRPPMAELRLKYYRNLDRFFEMPRNFLGFGDNSGRFVDVPLRNSSGLHSVYLQSETLFSNLIRLTRQYENWTILGGVDIRSFAQANLKEANDWKTNFDALKARRKALEKLQDLVKVGCFAVSFLPFKAAVENQLRQLGDILVDTLQTSATADIQAVETYIAQSLIVLNKVPDSVEDMGRTKDSYREIALKKQDNFILFSNIDRKAELLRFINNSELDTSALRAKWSTFSGNLDEFDNNLNKQKNRLIEKVEASIKSTKIKIDQFESRWKLSKPTLDDKMELTTAIATEFVSQFGSWEAQVTELEISAQAVVKECEHFDMPNPSFEVLEAVTKEIREQKASWALFGEWSAALEAFTKVPWTELRSKLFNFEDFLTMYKAKLQNSSRDMVARYIAKQVIYYTRLCPLLQKVRGEIFERDHWRTLFGLLQLPPDTLPKLTLAHFLQRGDLMHRLKDKINELAARAQGEVTIREAVQELKLWSEQCEFELLDHKTYSGIGTVLIKGWKDLFTHVSDKQALVANLKDSPFFPPFRDQATQIESKLGLLDNVLMTLNLVQRKWVYLEPIFSRGALPQEQERFSRIDAGFRGIMSNIRSNPKVTALADVPNLNASVDRLKDQLERCSRALSDFLEEKRSKFPRFYFIGDDDLLEILGQAQNPKVIENHLKKLFAGIHSVDLKDGRIVAMKSSAHEIVPLLQPVIVTGEVETWLSSLSVCMEETLKQMLIECVSECDYNRFPSQILCVAESIQFCKRAEQAIEAGGGSAFEELHRELKEHLQMLTTIDATEDHLLDLKIKALVLDLIHNIEVVELLRDNKVADVGDWLWQKQLRTYLDAKGHCVLRMVDAEFRYSYEYQGNAGKLVHTPLTDKCYLVLTQGMHLGYGGCPFGPAGTGKTESVKALGQFLGRQVLVFNCDEGIDFESMGRIFTGLVKSGAWGCFDEFNRLKEDQLSAVSQQIQTIQAALKNGEPECMLLGRSCEVNPNAAIFVTMNPASKEYGGRSKLPHNLKQLFRDVAMAVPDVSLIAEVILLSQGFQHARDLGRKVCEVYGFSRELLTPQRHYDWGLRALKTILGHAGELIHRAKRAGAVEKIAETKILIASLKINTLSKLTYDDATRFRLLLRDVFGQVEDEEIAYTKLETAIRAVLTERKLEVVASQIKKILQLYEALNQRMGVVVVGPSGCGKSLMLDVLHGALAKMNQKVVRHVMNPKALDREKLLGKMDVDTREWFDGVLTAAARKVLLEDSGVQTWIMCDGDIDPEWVESLNSVLDDNHLLTMPNGERIKFTNNVNFVFETNDLAYASPATVSRMGMIFMSEEDVDTKALVRSWIGQQDAKFRELLMTWFDELFFRALQWVLQANAFVVQTTIVGTITTAMSHLKGVTTKCSFVDALIRGMGCNLAPATRQEFATCIFTWCRGDRNLVPVDPKDPLGCYWSESAGAFISYSYDPEGSSVTGDTISYRNPPVVNTIDVQRNYRTIRPWLESMDPFIVVGPEGAGKTLLMRKAFDELKGATTVATIHCNAKSRPADLINKLSEVCTIFTTNKGRVYRPKTGSRVILFLKDLNLPSPDAYDTIQLISFLQQLITYQGFYDDNLEFVMVEKIQIVGSMNPSTTVGRNVLTTRFTAIVHIAFFDYPSDDQLRLIYSNYLQAVVRTSNKAVAKLSESSWNESNIDKLCASLVTLYQTVRKNFSPDDQRHYAFTPRDLTDLCFGLLRYDLSAQPLLMAFAHEATRIFGDRLVGSAAKKKFATFLSTLLSKDWRFIVPNETTYFTSLQQLPFTGPKETKAAKGGKSSKSGEETSNIPPALLEMGTMLTKMEADDFKALCQTGLYTYEREFKSLQMILFPEILEHVAYIDRVLSRPGGSLLLVGSQGVGRRTAVILICHILRINFVTPRLSANYSSKHFRVELKEILRRAGIEGEKICLFVEDYQLVQESFLEDINGLLSSSEVPGLYAPVEQDQLLAPIKESFLSSSSFGNGRSKTLWEYFLSRVAQNLHIVLSMNPLHPKFISRSERNPALFSKCQIVWLSDWSKASLQEVPATLLAPLSGNENEKKSGIDMSKLLRQILEIHNSCIPYGATPLKYVKFLNAYTSLYQEKQGIQIRKRNHLNLGLTKLKETASIVDKLSNDAEEKKKMVVSKQKEADLALERITAAMKRVTEKKKEASACVESLHVAEEKLSKRQEAISQELAGIQPLIDEAKQAVNGIGKNNLSEIRGLRAPPKPIEVVLAGVLMIMNQQDLSWKAMQTFLIRPSVKNEIIEFDAKQITSAIRKKVTAHIKANEDSFDPETLRRVNAAAVPLGSWVQANLKYSVVLEKVAPLEAEFKSANDDMAENKHRLHETEKELAALDVEVQDLRRSFTQTTQEAESLKLELKEKTDIKNRAQSLLGKLVGENERWGTQVAALDAELFALPTNALLAAAFTIYMGSSPEGERREIVNKWLGMCDMKTFEFSSFMVSESRVLEWKTLSLPSDNLSVQNAVIIAHASQVPFIIDPNGQAAKWLFNYMSSKAKGTEVIQQQDSRFPNILENAVRFGRRLIVQECDGVPAFLTPVIRKDCLCAGQRQVVEIGERQVDYNNEFRIFLMTRDDNPLITPDMAALINTVNFTITRSGLEDQLLAIVLQHEKPGLEKKKSELLAKEEKFKIEQAELEQALLESLASATGSILDNHVLLDSLNKTKSASLEISAALSEAQKIQADLNKQREAYRPVAANGSALYFLVSQLVAVSNMYSFSLPSFVRLFTATLDAEYVPEKEVKDGKKEDGPKSPVSPPVSGDREHLIFLRATLKIRVFQFVTRSLFKADRLMFALHLIHALHAQLFQTSEWEFFTGEFVPVDRPNTERMPSWAAPDREKAYKAFANAFPALLASLNFGNAGIWKPWMASQRCEREFPNLEKKPSAFQQLLVVSVLRPDRLQSAMENYASRALKLDDINPPPLDFANLLAESRCDEPIMFITTAGADPSADLEEFAIKNIGKQKYVQLAMGSGQQEPAMAAIRTAAATGGWVCLKNLHLLTPWLSTLEGTLKNLEKHPSFRLWLTTEEHPKFENMLLQSSLKLTYESPPGIKQNLKRTFSTWDSDFFATGSPIRAQILFVLAWFQAIVQERRTFIPQGWTKFYEFSFADLKSGAAILDSVFKRLEASKKGNKGGFKDILKGSNTSIDMEREFPWTTIWGLFEYAVFGGRIDNEQDARILGSYLRLFFSPLMLSLGGSPSRSKLSQGIDIPFSNKLSDFLGLIAAVPITDSPFRFGLASNADGAVQQTKSSNVLSQLKRLSVSSSLSARFERTVWQQLLTPMLTLWNRLLSQENTMASILTPNPEVERKSENYTPVDSFVLLELEKVRNLMLMVNTILSSLDDVCNKGALLSPVVQADGAILVKGETPWRWAKNWYGPESPLKWIQELAMRHQTLQSKWLSNVKSGSLLKQSINLSHLTRPRTFLNALRQLTARSLNVPIGSLKLVVAWNESLLPSSATVRANLEGLSLSGCGFVDGFLCALSEGAPVLTNMPTCTVCFLPKEMKSPYETDSDGKNQIIGVPVYVSPSREEFVAEFQMPCKRDAATQWILAGAALLLTPIH